MQHREVLFDQPLELNGGHQSMNPENEDRLLPGTDTRVRAVAFQVGAYSPTVVAA